MLSHFVLASSRGAVSKRKSQSQFPDPLRIVHANVNVLPLALIQARGTEVGEKETPSHTAAPIKLNKMNVSLKVYTYSYALCFF